MRYGQELTALQTAAPGRVADAGAHPEDRRGVWAAFGNIGPAQLLPHVIFREPETKPRLRNHK